MIVATDTESVVELGDFWLLLLCCQTSLCIEFAGHPNRGTVAKSALHIVPEQALLEGLGNGLPSSWLSQEVDLVGLILHLHLLLVILQVVIKAFSVVVVDADRRLHCYLYELGSILELFSLRAFLLDGGIDLRPPPFGIFSGLLVMLSK